MGLQDPKINPVIPALSQDAQYTPPLSAAVASQASLEVKEKLGIYLEAIMGEKETAKCRKITEKKLLGDPSAIPVDLLVIAYCFKNSINVNTKPEVLLQRLEDQHGPLNTFKRAQVA